MHKEFVMGNEAIAMGAMVAGVSVVSGYPGTPSTEVLSGCCICRKKNNGNNETGGTKCSIGSADESCLYRR